MSKGETEKLTLINLARMKSGRCALTVEGWVDLDGRPVKRLLDISFRVSEVRVRIHESPLQQDRLPCGRAEAVSPGCPEVERKTV